ncbi:MAG: serine/threonine-protein kinase PknK [Cyanobacteria bacterium P01_F01_bin.150]
MTLSLDQLLIKNDIQLLGYTLVECLYQGTKTVVCRARDIVSEHSVIIKFLNQDYPGFSALVQFRNQYTITKHLPIPGIVKPLKLEPLGNSYALVMEDNGCISLARYGQQHSLDVNEILAIAIQLAAILHDLHHHRVIHKDIKPVNILIHPDSKQVRLIDFSIASLLPKETQAIQSPKSLEGTLAYLAPEQTGRMNRAIDYRTDFYALGVTLYELLTGQLPFSNDDLMELIHCHMARIPSAVNQVNPEIPAAVAAIVAKLMAKNAEDHYQSALGLKYDLEQCLRRRQEQGQKQGQTSNFDLGQRDVSDRFNIPEKLYGREQEVQLLLDAFERVANGGREIMVVAGFSGIGKTAVINEVHKPITRQNGYFIKGKFDQFNRNIPFSAFVQAFRSLMGQLLSESDAKLANWRTQILEAVGENGQVLIEVIPELELIIGQQPPVAKLSGSAVQNRFNLLFQTFIAVFTTPEHPLVLFLDDLQWVDSASLNLLNLLLVEADTEHLLVLGAYRDNEVFPAHPLMLTLAEFKKQQAQMHILTLPPLAAENIQQLVADTFQCSIQLTAPLTALVMQKTQGNPFFATQLLQGLYDDGCVTFDAIAGHWQCDLAQVKQLALTNDVVEFMVRRLQKLPRATQDVLKMAACLGNRFDLNTLAVVCDRSRDEVTTDLWRSLQENLVIPENETYKFFQGDLTTIVDVEDINVGYRFLHDRVQQAASLLIADAQKPYTHYHIGKRLLAHFSAEEQEQNIFDITNYLNRGRQFVNEDAERKQLANLNWLAGQKALASTAYDDAIEYLNVGIEMLGESGWSHHYELMLKLYKALGSAQLSSVKHDHLEATITKILPHVMCLQT